MRIGQNEIFINPKRENYLDELIHDNTFRHGGVILGGFLLNPYILTIHKRVTTKHLSLPRLSPKSEERLEYIWKLHEEGKSNTYILDKMNKKYIINLLPINPTILL